MASNPYSYMTSAQNVPNTSTNPYAMDVNMGMGSGMQYSASQGRGGGTPNYRDPGTNGVNPDWRTQQQQQPQDQSWQSGSQASVNNPYANYQNMFDPAYWSNQQQAEQGQRYLDNTLPWAQYQQNQYQYAQDYNEAQRRWNTEMQRQQGLDQYQQGLSDKQFSLAEWQANIANSQWQDQFTQTKANDAFSQGLARDQFGLQQSQQQWNQNIQQQQQDNANRQTAIEAQYKAGLIDVQTAQNEIAKLNYQNQYTLGNRNADITQQNYLNQYQLGQGNLELSRQKLLQDAQQAAANRALQERLASIQATGRAQALPAARFISNW